MVEWYTYYDIGCDFYWGVVGFSTWGGEGGQYRYSDLQIQIYIYVYIHIFTYFLVEISTGKGISRGYLGITDPRIKAEGLASGPQGSGCGFQNFWVQAFVLGI